MTWTLDFTALYLGLPVKTGQKKTLLEITADGGETLGLLIPDCPEKSCDYYCWLRLPESAGKTLTLNGDLSAAFFAQVKQADKAAYAPLKRPLLHFTAERGWLNDPNGLVYCDGVYHLYFQYNPADTEWGNMSWGHAVSTDLLTFHQKDTVLLPDKTGVMFSGSGLVNERMLPGLPDDALVFFYTAAGGISPWDMAGEKKAFTQKIAVSTDGGRTLKKLPGEAVGVIGEDSRDPQVFWHEASGGYVMVLWIQGEEIALLRSENLRDWEMTDRFTLPGAFECPNLFCLPLPEQEKQGLQAEPVDEAASGQWVLTVADGSYYFGSFDGYRFVSDGVRRRSYLNELPYAAQVYNGIKDRTVMIAWLRTKNEGSLYTGAMSLPRELGLVRHRGTLLLQMCPVREYEASKRRLAVFENEKKGERLADVPAGRKTDAAPEKGFICKIEEEAVTELLLRPAADRTLTVEFFGNTLTVDRDGILFGEEHTSLPEAFSEVHLLIDRQIIEVYGNDCTQNAYYETGSNDLTGVIRVTGCLETPEVYQWKPKE